MKKEFKGKKILVMGLGLHGGGAAAVRFFLTQGAEVVVTDLKKGEELKKHLNGLRGANLKFVFGEHRKKDFVKADLIIRNPAVPLTSPYIRFAEKRGIPVKTDIEIFFDLVPPAQIIGITGTKGKSTTATLSYLFLKTKYRNVFLGGNIGISPLSFVSKINKKARIILELSSFELESLRKSPHIAVITKIFPDHLDRHKTFKNYLRAKENIFKYQKKGDILILNSLDGFLRRFASKSLSKVCFFDPEDVAKKYKLNFLTEADAVNISAAVKVGEIFKISQSKIKKTLSSFKGIPHRQELVAVKKEVQYINDTTATTPQSVVLGLEKFRKKFPGAGIILIAGGVDKGFDYKEMAEKIKKETNQLILLPGDASAKIKKKMKKNGIIEVKSMKEAVRTAARLSSRGGIVLLSPGAASFNIFKNEFDRGEQFIREVKELK
ncbi:MAG TPA: UDP-N-acetylmuramoyl-L-alanine--D-glutamate ligase [Candidatus Parcubacteria bacterium]|nr:UDP-N-acetylmuramoyl-L-alanine--D-glutamate ligase [Candidatus Parcubacteria bacterium]